MKRRSGLLLHMPCHLSEIEGLRWQGGSLERGCLAHRKIAGYRLFHRGHPLIAIFTHPLNVSITSMLKPINVRKNAFSTPSQPPHGDQEEKEGSLGSGGSRIAGSRRLPLFPLKKEQRERSFSIEKSSQCTQISPSRTLCACSSPKQKTQRLCVSSGVK